MRKRPKTTLYIVGYQLSTAMTRNLSVEHHVTDMLHLEINIQHGTM